MGPCWILFSGRKIIKKGCMMFAQNLFYKKNFFG